MADNDTILKACDISKTYRMGAARIEVLKRVNMAVERGQFIAATGASGSGKSTLLHVLGALDTPDSGHVEFEGSNLAAAGNARLNHYRNKSVGFVFQFYHLLDELNVVENTMLPAMTGTSVLGWLAIRRSIKKRAVEI